ncbi:13973_t:CDS:2 [Cetraspora pellucida]|uniref:13973_t:CDS:1 n=1 Tax=Cetraspora pellucida TaxID=1433469 RepID=A0ACA9K1W1_9GLOM|nr:13973_t:CDS:2 [Cetraspora pellucida]
MTLEIEEYSLYPSSPIIVYKEKKNNIVQHSFCYEIIEEGVYLNAPLSAYTFTSKGKKYKIPDQYGHKVSSTFSSSVTNKWEKAINPNSKTAWSGTLIFGLQLESVQKARKTKNRELKSIENCSDSTIIKRAKRFGNQALELLKSVSQNYYSKEDHISIKAIDYSINNYNFHIDFGKENLIKTKQHQLAVVQALDKATVIPAIPRKGAVSNERILLNKQIGVNIKIMQVNLDYLEVEEDSTDPKIEQEMINITRISKNSTYSLISSEFVLTIITRYSVTE